MTTTARSRGRTIARNRSLCGFDTMCKAILGMSGPNSEVPKLKTGSSHVLKSDTM